MKAPVKNRAAKRVEQEACAEDDEEKRPEDMFLIVADPANNQ
jgi:hypothetical protein